MPIRKRVSLQTNDSGVLQEIEETETARYVIPDLNEITKCSFYWGKIDQHEAAKLLEGKPEGTFLLRDSAQVEYLFSVSVRIKGQTLNARIDQYNNLYSFVRLTNYPFYSSATVTGLIEHYKTNPCYILDGAMLTTPLQRDFPFDLKHLARAALGSYLISDSAGKLPLPQTLKMYLMEYHNKQRARMFE